MISEFQRESEELERMGNMKHMEPDFQRAKATISESHDLGRSQLNKFAKDRLKKMRQTFEVASRVSSSNRDPDATRFILNNMFETINKTAEEYDDLSKNVMLRNLAVAFQTISGLSKKIRGSFNEQHVAKPVKSSRKEMAENVKLYFRMSLLFFICIIFAVISDDIAETYKNNNLQPPTIYQSALLMGITFVLFYLQQFQ